MKSLAQKVGDEIGLWKRTKLGPAKPDMYRFRLGDSAVKSETVKAWYVDIDGVIVWAAKSVCRIGMLPDGRAYGIDVPGWFAKEKKLIQFVKL